MRADELCEGDAERLQRVYRFLLQVCDYLRPRLQDEGAVDGLIALMRQHGFDRVHEDVGTLGRGLRRRQATPRLLKAYHDLRGGSMLALLMHLEMVQMELASPQDLTRIHILSRDQLKIMRNAVSDLDQVRRDADLQDKDHSIALIRQKWSDVGYRLSGREVTVELDCEFEGVVASCCMEFSTLDRVVYNLVNNAAQYAVDKHVRLSALPIDEVGDQETTLLRIVVLNRIEQEHRQALSVKFGDDLGAIFQGGFTTGGQGLGLRICGDLVTHGFSLPSIPYAVDHGYLGARLIEDWFVVWFHWPARRTPLAAAS
ncbi:MAG: hypothetical protein AAGF11_53775 [Myxococcota bacterium]